jgi:hypothetical protein
MLLGMTLVSACGGDDDDTSASEAATTTTAGTSAAAPAADTATVQTFVGAVEGTQALVAVTVEGSEVHAFYCDSVSVWGVLDGTASGGALSATDAVGNTLAATLADGSVSGTVTIDGTAHNFAAPLATGDAGAFLEEVRTGDLVETTAWVRDAAGAVTGAKFTVDLAILRTLPQFSATEMAVIDQIVATGVVPAPPTAGVPVGVVPFKFGSAIACGIAAFKFRRAQAAFGQNDTQANQDNFFNTGHAMETACGFDVDAL